MIWDNSTAIYRKMNCNLNRTPSTKTNSIIDLKIKPKPIQLLRENIGESLCGIGLKFLGIMPKQVIKVNIGRRHSSIG